ncbi:peptidoglycan-binding protein LysM [uncultured Tateyamaria sp.]|uniref:peptidoglycan-binding protein LysM n=1 Tax=Tateyamaria sp. TaxID=1929288 RepID=UPI002613CDE1|nr:peptidoglycan-binding protein LysM [uncultured Tateyamaria sp.]
MGLWSFVKGKGKSLLGGGDAPALNSTALEDEIAELGLDASGMQISVEGDTVKVAGAAVSQEMKEKVILAVGNVEGVAAVEDDVPSATDPVFHTVVPGDTLWGISAATLGNGARYEEIFEANKPMLSHPDKIYPGQVLRIPQD